MPDVIQTVVTQNGERIRIPIGWDIKTGESITAKDIEKAMPLTGQFGELSAIFGEFTFDR